MSIIAPLDSKASGVLTPDPIEPAGRSATAWTFRRLHYEPGQGLLMARFSAALMDHFQAPRNAGKLDSPDLVGVAGVPGLGRFVVLYLQIRDQRVTVARYECNGCGVTIACGSALTELVEGRTIDECRQLSEVDLITALDGVPADKADRVPFALAALKDALHQLGPPAELQETGAS